MHQAGRPLEKRRIIHWWKCPLSNVLSRLSAGRDYHTDGGYGSPWILTSGFQCPDSSLRSVGILCPRPTPQPLQKTDNRLSESTAPRPRPGTEGPPEVQTQPEAGPRAASQLLPSGPLICTGGSLAPRTLERAEDRDVSFDIRTWYCCVTGARSSASLSVIFLT